RHGSWPRALPRSAAAPARYRYSCCVNLPRCAPRAGRKPLTVGLPGKTPQWFVWRAHALRPRSDPHGRADQHSDTDDPGDHAFRSGAETAEPVTTGRVVAVRHRLHVGHDVPLLLGGELSVGELRHVLRTALHRGVNLFLGGGCELRRELTRRQRTTLPGEVVTRRTVQAEQLRTARGVGPPQLSTAFLGTLRTTTVGLDVGAQRVDLLGRQPRRLTQRLRFLTHHRHPATGGLEVHRRLADPDQARPAALHALEVLAVAADAGVVVDLLALADQRRVLLRLRGLRLRREHRVEPACAHQRNTQCQHARHPATELRAPTRPPLLGGAALLHEEHLLWQPLLSVRPKA